jgi:hypothetical protein
MNKKWITYAVVALAAYVLRDQIAKVPGVNKLPSV